ncbi:ATP synthase F1 subunit epsilon [Catenisphaera adipataccumulans]|jgi:F-type H+-transporting ATPase subunit epsilon|uniref:ATP synthase epsilon chain n=1 Tax=Catenisphaera adipataccumulans TaxID=700500 RepID=A0A7W8FWX4_9FIRM|nr:ATP synthase F1 subunit epsilon [Catenisphaera adipataccumulans]MBB5182392.1 F-type H+-transporting ATPase subunit epsilon [Catenisphaera adipataccumulans]
MEIKVVTPRGVYMKQTASAVHLASTEGEMTVLEHHVPIFAALVPCPLILTAEDGTKKEYALSGGFMKYGEGDCLILTDAIEGREEIDIERARQAYQRARDRIEKKDALTNMKRANLALARAINRIHVYEMK